MTPEAPQSFQGIILVDKEEGLSSFAVIARLRRMLAIKRIGHSGTLDPFATGLLPCLVGRATALLPYMEDDDKEYEADIILGQRRDTMDSEGEVIASCPREELIRLWQSGELEHRVSLALASLQGEIEQLPPMYSAVKIDGRPLYRYAREGKVLERKRRVVRVELLSREALRPAWTDSDAAGEAGAADAAETPPPLLRLRLRVSKGTYIRVIADDLGELTGVHAYCQKLKRLACGAFRLEEANTTEHLFDIFNRLERDPWRMRAELQTSGRLRNLLTAFPERPRILLNRREASEILTGKPIPLSLTHEETGLLARKGMAASPDRGNPPFFLAVYEERLLAVGRLQGGAEGDLEKSPLSGDESFLSFRPLRVFGAAAEL